MFEKHWHYLHYLSFICLDYGGKGLNNKKAASDKSYKARLQLLKSLKSGTPILSKLKTLIRCETIKQTHAFKELQTELTAQQHTDVLLSMRAVSTSASSRPGSSVGPEVDT